MKGRAISLATPEDAKVIDAIEKLIGKTVPRQQIDGFDSAELDAEADTAGSGRSGSRRKPAAKSGGRNQRPEKPKKPEQAAAKKPGDGAPRRRKQDDDDRDEAPAGFGDDIPAFLQQPGRR
jgi:hypothetical protein